MARESKGKPKAKKTAKTPELLKEINEPVLFAYERNDRYKAYSGLPFLTTRIESTKEDIDRNAVRYFTQLEVNGGIGIIVRAGVNLGEATDFLLGWIGVDLMKDDGPPPGPDREVPSCGRPGGRA